MPFQLRRLQAEEPATAVCEQARDRWKGLRDGFTALMNEEERLVRGREQAECLHAFFTNRELGECEAAWFGGGTSESLLARFELLATEAGIALGLPAGSSATHTGCEAFFFTGARTTALSSVSLAKPMVSWSVCSKLQRFTVLGSNAARWTTRSHSRSFSSNGGVPMIHS
jgi:hypothetical protein